MGLGTTSGIKKAQLHEGYKKKGPVRMVSTGTYGMVMHYVTMSVVECLSNGLCHEGDHMLVLMENGDVYSHGAGYNSVLGLGDNAGKTRPEKVKGLDGVDVVALSADNKCSVNITHYYVLFL